MVSWSLSSWKRIMAKGGLYSRQHSLCTSCYKWRYLYRIGVKFIMCVNDMTQESCNLLLLLCDFDKKLSNRSGKICKTCCPSCCTQIQLNDGLAMGAMTFQATPGHRNCCCLIRRISLSIIWLVHACSLHHFWYSMHTTCAVHATTVTVVWTRTWGQGQDQGTGLQGQGHGKDLMFEAKEWAFAAKVKAKDFTFKAKLKSSLRFRNCCCGFL